MDVIYMGVISPYVACCCMLFVVHHTIYIFCQIVPEILKCSFLTSYLSFHGRTA